MKQLLMICLLVGFFAASAELRPDLIPSKLSELKAKNWYLEKSKVWKDYLTENPTDEEGWLHFFRAAKYGGADHNELMKVSEQIGSQFPASSVYQYVLFENLGWSEEGIEKLERAFELSGKATIFLEEKLLLKEYQLEGERAVIAHQIFEKGLINESTLKYGYNVLMSVGQDGLLFTDASHTSIPLWVLQDVMSVRKDVTIINLELATSMDYLNRKLSAESLKIPATREWSAVPDANPSRDFYYALTVPRKNLTEIEDNLYVVGLASQLGSQRLDHYNSLRENIENKFLLDYLTIDFNGEPNTSTGKVLGQNYIVPFLLLKEYYDEQGLEKESSRWKDLIISVAEKSQLKARVELMLSKNTLGARDFKKIEIDVKELDKNLWKIKDNIYASGTELHNNDYNFFLDYLKENRYVDLLEKAMFDLSKYNGDTLYLYKIYHFRKDAFGNYPAININYEAANIYCEWLTAQYNVQDKRKFKKVKFRLPSEKEWSIAALGQQGCESWEFDENTVKAKLENRGKEQVYDVKEHQISYPWFSHRWELRNSITNDKSCFLANVKTSDERVCPSGIKGDGYAYTSPVGTYFANRIGLYDVVGNVAEMTSQDGKAMGGSWNHTAEESTITSVVNYQSANDHVGFRLFMEVIEE